MLKFTPEQGDIIDHVEAKDGILLVHAGAGTGKTFIAKHIANLLDPRKGLYTAFNKAIVEEGTSRFHGTNMECKTFHALAYKHVKPTQKISDLTYTCIEENISYPFKFEIITAIDMFYVSRSVDMYQFFEDHIPEEDPARNTKIDLCIKYVEKMVNDELPPTFNFMLKFFHLMLVEGTANCDYDLVILDEINDTTAVALEIFKLIPAAKKIGLGETNQAIYHFLNLVNGFEELADEPVLYLTHSWRCSEIIAQSIQNFMRKDVSEDFNFVGTDDPVANGKFLYCTMTNALIVSEIQNRIDKNKGFHLLRKISEIFAAPMAVASAAAGKVPYQKKYGFLADEYKNYVKKREKGQSYMMYLLENVDDFEVQSAIRLLLSFQRKNINLFDLYKKAKESPVDLNYTIATVFTSKGLEFETVEIGDDLNVKIESIRENGGIQNQEDLVAYRCYYVACSRAGKNLLSARALRV
jgi:hypothetical protein